MSERLKIADKEPESVLVVGSVAYDNIITPTNSGERILGGSASYAALAASYLAPVKMVGVVGNDFAEKDLNRLKARGIDLEGLEVDKSGPTFFWSGKYHENYNKRDTLELELNVFEKFRPQLPQSYRSLPYVMLGNIGPDLLLHVCGQLENRKNTFVIADTIDIWIEIQKNNLLELLKKIDCFVINDSEALLLSEKNNIIDAGHELRRLGVPMTIIKKGEHGAYLFHDEGMFAIPAYPVTNLQDPTGAGDAFAGAFIAALAATGDKSFAGLKRAMLYGTAAASLTVEAFSCDHIEHAGPEAIHHRRDELLKIISI